MNLSNQLDSLWDEKSWGSDSFMKSSLYKVQTYQTSYGDFSGSDYKDYYQFSSGIGAYTIFVTGDSINGFKTSTWNYNFNIKILDSSGNDIGLTSSSYDTYTKQISFTSKTDSTYYLEITNALFTDFSYATTIKLDASSSTSSTTNSNFLSGTLGNDYLTGTNNADTLNGGLGNDTLSGGLGDDTYYVYLNTVIKENNNEGVDIIWVGGNGALDLYMPSYLKIPDNVENVGYFGTGKFYCDGNTLDNRASFLGNGSITFYGYGGNDIVGGGDSDDSFYGGEGDDSIHGMAGNDLLMGGDGNDFIMGGDGNDYVNGGIGNDIISGGLGIDTLFVSGSKSEYIISINNMGIGYKITSISEGTDLLADDIELIYFIKDKLSYNIDSLLSKVNNPPTGTPSGFITGIKDTNYTINSAGLLSGFTDADGDTLSVTNLTATNGKIISNTDGTWLLTPDKDFNGSLQLSYTVSDNKGGSVNTSFNFVLNPVNDVPIGKPTAAFDAITEDLTYYILKDADFFKDLAIQMVTCFKQ
jgi:Ca2+-binding RTX toxin-like protein